MSRGRDLSSPRLHAPLTDRSEKHYEIKTQNFSPKRENTNQVSEYGRMWLGNYYIGKMTICIKCGEKSFNRHPMKVILSQRT
jgi:hypothetical protein